MSATEGVLGEHCPDGGTCHHQCGTRCFRVTACGPMSGVYPGDRWPQEVRKAHQGTDLGPLRRAIAQAGELQRVLQVVLAAHQDEKETARTHLQTAGQLAGRLNDLVREVQQVLARATADSSELCSQSKRADSLHSWRFDGDDPRIICMFCDEMRDALSGIVLRRGMPT